MSTAELISADLSDTQITQESSGSLDPSNECKYLMKQEAFTKLSDQ